MAGRQVHPCREARTFARAAAKNPDQINLDPLDAELAARAGKRSMRKVHRALRRTKLNPIIDEPMKLVDRFRRSRWDVKAQAKELKEVERQLKDLLSLYPGLDGQRARLPSAFAAAAGIAASEAICGLIAYLSLPGSTTALEWLAISIGVPLGAGTVYLGRIHREAVEPARPARRSGANVATPPEPRWRRDAVLVGASGLLVIVLGETALRTEGFARLLHRAAVLPVIGFALVQSGLLA